MILEEYIKTPVQAQCDVLVCGGGFAGISAALAAARQGKKVILLEKQFVLGGLATAGLVTIYLPLCDGLGRQVSLWNRRRIVPPIHLYGRRGKISCQLAGWEWFPYRRGSQI